VPLYYDLSCIILRRPKKLELVRSIWRDISLDNFKYNKVGYIIYNRKVQARGARQQESTSAKFAIELYFFFSALAKRVNRIFLRSAIPSLTVFTRYPIIPHTFADFSFLLSSSWILKTNRKKNAIVDIQFYCNMNRRPLSKTATGKKQAVFYMLMYIIISNR
jgi:hypothetical protein